MVTVYMVCAVVGGAVLVLQMVLTLLGTDHALDMFSSAGDTGALHDLGHDHHGNGHFFGILSFKSLMAALAFFGLGGLWALSEDWTPYLAFVAAMGAAAAAMFLVAWVMRVLASLVYEGTVHVENAVGQIGTVYLQIPGHQTGLGKVTVTVQSQSLEFDAVTREDAIPTGTPVMVVGMSGPSTLEVAPSAAQDEAVNAGRMR